MSSLSNHFNVNQLKIYYLIKTIYVFSQHSLKTTLRQCPHQLQFYLEKEDGREKQMHIQSYASISWSITIAI